MRTNNKTIGDKPSFYLNEKFQIYYIKTDSNAKTDYFSVNFVFSHHKNFAVIKGVEGEYGLGDYKNPIFPIGFGFYSAKDMVFKPTTSLSQTYFLKMGYRNDIHLFIDSNIPITVEDNDTYREYFDMDILLGDKMKSPIF